MTLLRNHVRRRTIGTAGVLLASALLLTGCGAGGAPNGAKSTGQASDKNVASMAIGLGGTVHSLDQAVAYDSSSYPVINLLIEGLMTYDPSGALRPNLATKVEHPNPLTYVYTLRSGLKFWNGDPVTAEDAAFSLKRNMDPHLASVLAGYYSSVKDIVASGPDQVTMTLKHVDPFAQYIPAFGGGVIEKKYAESEGKAFGTDKGLTMGTGPYKVTSYTSSGLNLVRNEKYWGTKPTIAALKFSEITDPDSLRLAMQSGDIEATFGADPASFNVWDKLPGVTMTYTDGMAMQYLSLETTTQPFNDVHVRKAIAYATNAAGLLPPLFNGHAGLSKSPIIASAWGNFPEQAAQIKATYNSLPSYPFDMKKAAAELAQSSHPHGFTVTVPYPSAPTYLGRTLENLKQNLKQIGITLNLQETTGEKWGGNIWANPPGLGMQIAQFGMDYPDPGNFPALTLGKANSTPNALGTAKFTTPQLEKLLAQQSSTTDPAQRVNALTGIMKIMADQVPYIPLFQTYDALALSNHFVYTGKFSHWTYMYGDWAVHLKAAK